LDLGECCTHLWKVCGPQKPEAVRGSTKNKEFWKTVVITGHRAAWAPHHQAAKGQFQEIDTRRAY